MKTQKTFRVLPYKIMAAPLSMANYLAGFSYSTSGNSGKIKRKYAEVYQMYIGE